MALWRISRRTTLDGAGGLIAPARWHSRGRRVVYLAESPAGALLEVLVHLEVDPLRPPVGMKIMKVDEDAASSLAVTPSSLPAGWAKDLGLTRSIGDEWLAARDSALLRVPSAIVPETMNVLLNPEHPDAARVSILKAEDLDLDDRLL